MQRLLRAILVVALLIAVRQEHSVVAADIDFQQDVLPILRKHCFECHGDESREGGLRLTNRADALALNDSGIPAIVPHHPTDSELIRRLTTDDDDLKMPLDAERLSANEVTAMTRWIEQGAKWPPTFGEQPKHWSYVAPQRPQRPIVRNTTWPQSEIDYFVLAGLEAAGLSTSERASRGRLLRRVYLDLIGLPPTIRQQNEFFADTSDLAFEKVVDQLLSSKHFGEKWARGWLDLARYSDSNGYQADQIREMWAFRDWVIDALNNDMPFDQFTIEQLAGDLLPSPTIAQKVATGFHRATTCNVEAGVDPEGNRTDQVVDRVNTTATVWLGTTLECAQCHNHKYDPFSQKEYYQVFSFFNNTPVEVRKDNENPKNVQFNFWGPKLKLELDDDVIQKRAQAESELAEAKANLRRAKDHAKSMAEEWESSLSEPQRKALPRQVKAAISIESNKRTKQQTNQIVAHLQSIDAEVIRCQDKLTKLSKLVEELAPDSTLVMVELPEPRQTNIMIRGEFLNKGPEVAPAVPDVLHSFPRESPRNRLGFARWLVSPNNPLVARVTVNRWWAEIFGTGIVRTSEDFGTQGDPPSHPELLDWLSIEFMESGWSMKHVLKQIVMSATYQQDSNVSDESLLADPGNRLLSRGPRFRLPAESIRDNALRISGLLSDYQRGEPVYPPQPAGLWKQTGRNEPIYNVDLSERRYRRGIYVVWRRAAPYPSFVNFDAPDRMSCVVERSVTNTPLQALTLLNDEVYVEAAKALALAISDEPANSIDDRIHFAFRRTLARTPNAEELKIVRQLYNGELMRLAAASDRSSEIIGSFADWRESNDPADLNSWGAWFCVANVLLNLDETITKN